MNKHHILDKHNKRQNKYIFNILRNKVSKARKQNKFPETILFRSQTSVVGFLLVLRFLFYT